jgi:hypothetical protein
MYISINIDWSVFKDHSISLRTPDPTPCFVNFVMVSLDFILSHCCCPGLVSSSRPTSGTQKSLLFQSDYWEIVNVPKAQAHRAASKVQRWWIWGVLMMGRGGSGCQVTLRKASHWTIVCNTFGECNVQWTLETSCQIRKSRRIVGTT